MTNCTDYRVVVRDYDNCFELIAPNGDILLTTQNVSVQTLVKLVTNHKEGRATDEENI